MDNSVIISIRPEWCRKIITGEKTLEIRKTKPKLETPFKCYIYCTHSGSGEFFKSSLYSDIAWWNGEQWGKKIGKVIGEFTCNGFYTYSSVFPEANTLPEFIVLRRSCLTHEQIAQYENPNVIGTTLMCGVHAWDVSDVVVYDRPKDLSEFGFKHAPQSWAYCGVNGNG